MGSDKNMLVVKKYISGEYGLKELGEALGLSVASAKAIGETVREFLLSNSSIEEYVVLKFAVDIIMAAKTDNSQCNAPAVKKPKINYSEETMKGATEDRIKGMKLKDVVAKYDLTSGSLVNKWVKKHNDKLAEKQTAPSILKLLKQPDVIHGNIVNGVVQKFSFDKNVVFPGNSIIVRDNISSQSVDFTVEKVISGKAVLSRKVYNELSINDLLPSSTGITKYSILNASKLEIA